jgi:hypothetical protein
MIPSHRNMRCNNITTPQHWRPLTTLHDKCQHANSNTHNGMLQKTLWQSLIHAVTQIIYTLWQVLYITRRDKLSFHMIRRGRVLGMRRRAFPDIVQNTLPRWRTNIDTYRQQTKKKYLTRIIHEEYHEQASLMTLQITDMLKYGSRFMTYYGIRTG